MFQFTSSMKYLTVSLYAVVPRSLTVSPFTSNFLCLVVDLYAMQLEQQQEYWVVTSLMQLVMTTPTSNMVLHQEHSQATAVWLRLVNQNNKQSWINRQIRSQLSLLSLSLHSSLSLVISLCVLPKCHCAFRK